MVGLIDCQSSGAAFCEWLSPALVGPKSVQKHPAAVKFVARSGVQKQLIGLQKQRPLQIPFHAGTVLAVSGVQEKTGVTLYGTAGSHGTSVYPLIYLANFAFAEFQVLFDDNAMQPLLDQLYGQPQYIRFPRGIALW